MRAIPGLLALLVGAALLGGPWWSSTLLKLPPATLSFHLKELANAA